MNYIDGKQSELFNKSINECTILIFCYVYDTPMIESERGKQKEKTYRKTGYRKNLLTYGWYQVGSRPPKHLEMMPVAY